jgi:hypothetical protein
MATKEKWRMLDGKVESGLISDSELQGGSPHLCRLMTHRLVPVNKIDYVLAHMWFMGSTNLVASSVTELDDTLPHFTDV